MRRCPKLWRSQYQDRVTMLAALSRVERAVFDVYSSALCPVFCTARADTTLVSARRRRFMGPDRERERRAHTMRALAAALAQHPDLEEVAAALPDESRLALAALQNRGGACPASLYPPVRRAAPDGPARRAKSRIFPNPPPSAGIAPSSAGIFSGRTTRWWSLLTSPKNS